MLHRNVPAQRAGLAKILAGRVVYIHVTEECDMCESAPIRAARISRVCLCGALAWMSIAVDQDARVGELRTIVRMDGAIDEHSQPPIPAG